MKKRFLAIALLCFFIIKGFSQSIYYSNNKLNISEYRYKIIGEVNNSIIVWATDLAKYGPAKIFVFDNSMHLINTINTNIIQSGMNEDARFIITGKTFQLLYSYKTKDSFLFRLAAFNEKGSMLYERTLDSITNSDALNNQNIYYQILRSQYNNAGCFTKMLKDRQHHLLKFSFSFVSDTGTSSKTFTIPFNEDLEDITDMLVDDDKNVLLLKQRKLDSAIELTLVKLNFTDNLMLGANKTISNYFFKANSMHIAQRAGGYTVFGLLRKENRSFGDHNKKEGLYVWQTDNELGDAPGDAILNQETSNEPLSYSSSVSGNDVFPNVFAIWKTSENAGTPQKQQWSYAAQYDNAYLHSYDNRNSTGSAHNSNLAYDEDGSRGTITSVEPVREIEEDMPLKLKLIKIDNSNKIIWQNAVNDNINNITAANLNNTKIIAGNKSLHVIYEVLIKYQPGSLNHITIQPDGAFTEKLFTNWDKKYKYDLVASVFTDEGDLIVPAYKGRKVSFVKLKLE